MINQQKILIFIGPPGVGKGFYASWLQNNYPFTSLSSGDIARNLAQSKTTLGKKVYLLLKAGQLLAPKLINALVLESIYHEKNPYLILDGYPRNLKQWEFFFSKVDINKLLFCFFLAPYQLCYQRVKNRQFCSQCGKNYNRQTNPSKVLNICDQDQTTLQDRIDVHKFSTRYTIFEKETLPMLQTLKQRFPHLFWQFYADDQATVEIKNQLHQLCATHKINKL